MKVALLALLLAGCTTSFTMRHPDGRTAECGGYFTGFQAGYQVAERERGCVTDFQRQGFERVP